jgi:hypothetical protein
VIAALAAMVALAGAPLPSPAGDDAAAFRTLATGQDFRERVSAALALGKSTSPGARPALEKALSDAHPAVRAAAAAALGALGDARALPALKAQLAAESAPNVKAQLETTIKRLGSSGAPGAAATKTKFLVSVGKIENKSGVSAATLTPALKASTRSRVAQVPGVELLDEGADPGAAARSRNLPAFTLDASLTQLSKRQGSDGVGYSARVEYLIRKMPDQALKGTMAGAAAAVADASQVRGPTELGQLQLEALAAAVDAALKGATPAFEAATR